MDNFFDDEWLLILLEKTKIVDIRLSEINNELEATIVSRTRENKLYDIKFTVLNLGINQIIYERNTKESLSLKQLLENIAFEVGRDRAVNQRLEDDFLNILTEKLESAFIDYKIKRFQDELEINFTKIEEQKDYFLFKCDVNFFGEKFSFRASKYQYQSIFLDLIFGDKVKVIKDKWFMDKIHEWSKERSLYCYGEHFSRKNFTRNHIIKKVLIAKLKENKTYKMLILYNPETKKYFN